MTGVEFQLCGSQALAVLDKACVAKKKKIHTQKKKATAIIGVVPGVMGFMKQTHIYPPRYFIPPGFHCSRVFPSGDVFLALLSRLFFGSRSTACIMSGKVTMHNKARRGCFLRFNYSYLLLGRVRSFCLAFYPLRHLVAHRFCSSRVGHFC